MAVKLKLVAINGKDEDLQSIISFGTTCQANILIQCSMDVDHDRCSPRRSVDVALIKLPPDVTINNTVTSFKGQSIHLTGVYQGGMQDIKGKQCQLFVNQAGTVKGRVKETGANINMSGMSLFGCILIESLTDTPMFTKGDSGTVVTFLPENGLVEAFAPPSLKGINGWVLFCLYVGC